MEHAFLQNNVKTYANVNRQSKVYRQSFAGSKWENIIEGDAFDKLIHEDKENRVQEHDGYHTIFPSVCSSNKYKGRQHLRSIKNYGLEMQDLDARQSLARTKQVQSAHKTKQNNFSHMGRSCLFVDDSFSENINPSIYDYPSTYESSTKKKRKKRKNSSPVSKYKQYPSTVKKKRNLTYKEQIIGGKCLSLLRNKPRMTQLSESLLAPVKLIVKGPDTYHSPDKCNTNHYHTGLQKINYNNKTPARRQGITKHYAKPRKLDHISDKNDMLHTSCTLDKEYSNSGRLVYDSNASLDSEYVVSPCKSRNLDTTAYNDHIYSDSVFNPEIISTPKVSVASESRRKKTRIIDIEELRDLDNSNSNDTPITDPFDKSYTNNVEQDLLQLSNRFNYDRNNSDIDENKNEFLLNMERENQCVCTRNNNDTCNQCAHSSSMDTVCDSTESLVFDKSLDSVLDNLSALSGERSKSFNSSPACGKNLRTKIIIKNSVTDNVGIDKYHIDYPQPANSSSEPFFRFGNCSQSNLSGLQNNDGNNENKEVNKTYILPKVSINNKHMAAEAEYDLNYPAEMGKSLSYNESHRFSVKENSESLFGSSNEIHDSNFETANNSINSESIVEYLHTSVKEDFEDYKMSVDTNLNNESYSVQVLQNGPFLGFEMCSPSNLNGLQNNVNNNENKEINKMLILPVSIHNRDMTAETEYDLNHSVEMGKYLSSNESHSFSVKQHSESLLGSCNEIHDFNFETANNSTNSELIVEYLQENFEDYKTSVDTTLNDENSFGSSSLNLNNSSTIPNNESFMVKSCLTDTETNESDSFQNNSITEESNWGNNSDVSLPCSENSFKYVESSLDENSITKESNWGNNSDVSLPCSENSFKYVESSLDEKTLLKKNFETICNSLSVFKSSSSEFENYRTNLNDENSFESSTRKLNNSAISNNESGMVKSCLTETNKFDSFQNDSITEESNLGNNSDEPSPFFDNTRKYVETSTDEKTLVTKNSEPACSSLSVLISNIKIADDNNANQIPDNKIEDFDDMNQVSSRQLFSFVKEDLNNLTGENTNFSVVCDPEKGDDLNVERLVSLKNEQDDNLNFSDLSEIILPTNGIDNFSSSTTHADYKNCRSTLNPSVIDQELYGEENIALSPILTSNEQSVEQFFSNFSPDTSSNTTIKDNQNETNKLLSSQCSIHRKKNIDFCNVTVRRRIQLSPVSESPNLTDESTSEKHSSTNNVMSLHLPAGKKWRRSLITLRNLHNKTCLNNRGFNKKGRNWSKNVEDLINQQNTFLGESLLYNTISISKSFANLSLHPTIFESDEDDNDTIGNKNATTIQNLTLFGKQENCEKPRFSLSVKPLYENQPVNDLLSSISSVDKSSTLVDSRASENSSSEESCNNYTIVAGKLDFASAKYVVLSRCHQTCPLPFEGCFPDSQLKKCHKIGEGVYGEVFMLQRGRSQCSVLKIIPIEGDELVNGEKQKKYEEILSEIVISCELSNLRGGSSFYTDSYCEVRRCWCVRGKYPQRLIDLWDEYDAQKGSENDSPAMFTEEQLFIVLELSNAGESIESFIFNNAQQTFSVFKQTVFALAVAQEALQFEHRDLHVGNILVSHTKNKEAVYRLNDKKYSVKLYGVKVTIIDFTLSRITYNGITIFNNMAEDPELFTAEGDFQFEVYRLMRTEVKLCCQCGTPIQPNPANMCVGCVRTRIDITEDIPKQVTIQFCRNCERYFQPPNEWISCTLESRELLSLCLRKLKGLNKLKLVDAAFVWTEPHSKRIKVKLTVHGEVFGGTVLQQVFIVEYVVTNQMCNDCHRSEAQDYWRALVQLRHHVTGSKKTVYYVEQLILKHKAHENAIKIESDTYGIDFYFSTDVHARKMVDFFNAVLPCRHQQSKHLMSHDIHSNVYNYKFTHSIEVVPLAKDGVVCLSKSIANKLGGIGQLCLVTRLMNTVHLMDPTSAQIAEINSTLYWRDPFSVICLPHQLKEYIVMDTEPVMERDRQYFPGQGAVSSKHLLADVWVVKASNLGITDNTIHTRSHLGHILKPGDSVLGYSISDMNVNNIYFDKMPADIVPDVILVKKFYPDRQKHRNWKLKHMKATSKYLSDHQQDYEEFMNDLEEDPEYRRNIDIYKSQKSITIEKNNDIEEVDIPHVTLEEMLDDLHIGDTDSDDDGEYMDT